MTLIRDLGDGLILRHATPADADALATFNAEIHGEGNAADEAFLAAWTRALLSGLHPTFAPSDFTIVEETSTGRIVSSLNHISQQWTYGGVAFGVGRPELVGTHPDYRKHGLVRAQFAVIHQWSVERGELVQAITGIPHYYRQFGYEMCVDLGGRRRGYEATLPRLKDGEVEPYRVRAALEADLPFIAEMYDLGTGRSLLACQHPSSVWHYELLTCPDIINRRGLCVIENPAGERVGFFTHPPMLWNDVQPATWYELIPGASWKDITPSVLRYLWQVGVMHAERAGQTCAGVGFNLGRAHPAYTVCAEALPQAHPPYAWYLRVPDLPAFLRRIAPVLAQRLAASTWAGHSGELKLSFYKTGMRLLLEGGQLTEAVAWDIPARAEVEASFPAHTFLQLLFGHRTMEELEHSFADCAARDEATRALLNVLFPKQASAVWPID